MAVKKLLLLAALTLSPFLAFGQSITPGAGALSKNAPYGIVGLDGAGHVPAAQLNFGTTAGTVADGGALTAAQNSANSAAAGAASASAAVASLHRNLNTFAMIGTSREAQQSDFGPTMWQYFNNANYFHGQKYQLIYNDATSGYTSRQFFAGTAQGSLGSQYGIGLAGALASRARFVIIGGIINDPDTPTGDQVWDCTVAGAEPCPGYKQAIQQIVANGQTPVLTLEYGQDGLQDVAKINQIERFNQIVREYCGGTATAVKIGSDPQGECLYLDFTSAMVNQQTSTNLTASVNGSVAPGTTSFTGSITGNQMTVTAVSGTLYPRTQITGAGVTTGLQISRQLSGTTGGTGTYEVWGANGFDYPTVASEALTDSYGVLTITAVGSGFVVDGASLTGTGVPGQTGIVADGTGVNSTGTYILNNSFTVASEALTAGPAINWKYLSLSQDGTHSAAGGGYAMGEVFNAVLGPLVPTTTAPSTSPADNGLDNGNFAIQTGGTYQGGGSVTGSVPEYWSINVPTGVSIASSYVANPNDSSQLCWQLSITNNASTTANPTPNIMFTNQGNLVGQDQAWFQGGVDIYPVSGVNYTGSSTNLIAFNGSAYPVNVNDAVSFPSTMMGYSAYGQMVTTQTYPAQYVAGTGGPYALNLRIAAQFLGNGNVVEDICDPWMIQD